MSDTSGERHLTETDYVGMVTPLHDLERVLIDLQRLAEGRTVVASDEYVFLCRRARGLARACVRLAEGEA